MRRIDVAAVAFSIFAASMAGSAVPEPAEPRLAFPARTSVSPELRAFLEELFARCEAGLLTEIDRNRDMFTPELLLALQREQDSPEEDRTDPLLDCGATPSYRDERTSFDGAYVTFAEGPTRTGAHVHIFNGLDELIVDPIVVRTAEGWRIRDLIFRDSGSFMLGRPWQPGD